MCRVPGMLAGSPLASCASVTPRALEALGPAAYVATPAGALPAAVVQAAVAAAVPAGPLPAAPGSPAVAAPAAAVPVVGDARLRCNLRVAHRRIRRLKKRVGQLEELVASLRDRPLRAWIRGAFAAAVVGLSGTCECCMWLPDMAAMDSRTLCGYLLFAFCGICSRCVPSVESYVVCALAWGSVFAARCSCCCEALRLVSPGMGFRPGDGSRLPRPPFVPRGHIRPTARRN